MSCDDTPVTREERHHRAIDLRFFRRSDGLYEVEGQLVDRKTHPFRRVLHADDTPAGSALHDITVRLVLDTDLRVIAADATMASTPFPICGGAAATLAPLVGLQIGAGWNRRVREFLGGRASCTHIVELLGPMATTAFQGVAPERLARIASGDAAERERKIDSCFAYDAGREVVATLWPARRRSDSAQ